MNKEKKVTKICVLTTPDNRHEATIKLEKSFCDAVETDIQKAVCLLHILDALDGYKFTMREVRE